MNQPIMMLENFYQQTKIVDTPISNQFRMATVKNVLLVAKKRTGDLCLGLFRYDAVTLGDFENLLLIGCSFRVN